MRSTYICFKASFETLLVLTIFTGYIILPDLIMRHLIAYGLTESQSPFKGRFKRTRYCFTMDHLSIRVCNFRIDGIRVKGERKGEKTVANYT